MEKLNIPFPIIVEGKYDKIKIHSIADAYVISTNGFQVFKNRELVSLIRSLAEKTPIIVLTDSDGGGKVIRSHITSVLPKEKLIQLYIPQVAGKEKRKTAPSAEGFLGVEGIDAEYLYRLLKPYHGMDASFHPCKSSITKLDFYLDGLSGKANSAEKRNALSRMLNLPVNMTANALLAAVNILWTREEYLAFTGREETKS